MEHLHSIVWEGKKKVTIGDVGTFFGPLSENSATGKVKRIMEGRNYAALIIRHSHDDQQTILKW